MSDKPSSTKSVLWGILLGFAIIAGVLFYPTISEFFKTAPSQRVQEPADIVPDKESTEEPSGKEQEEPPPDTTETDRDKQSDAALQETIRKPIAPVAEPENKIASFYAEEEALWKALLQRSISPEYLADYPYAECFKSSAEENNLPVALVLGLAGYLSNFDPEYRMDNKSGIMHLDTTKREGYEEEQIYDPCQDIGTACRLLAEFISKSRGEFVPALVAYRDQAAGVHPEDINRKDLFFLSQVKSHVEAVFTGPYEEKILYALKKFDSITAAKRFIESIKKSSGVDLSLEQKDLMYVVSIPAKDENERDKKAAQIKEKAGIY